MAGEEPEAGIEPLDRTVVAAPRSQSAGYGVRISHVVARRCAEDLRRGRVQ
jgi:hypothetical protein